MPAYRLPWVKLWIESSANEKIGSLNDRLFRTWICILIAAGQQKTRGRFANVRHAANASGRPDADIRALIRDRLLDDISRVTDDAYAKGYSEPGLWVHDWRHWQDRHPSDVRPRDRATRSDAGDRVLDLDDLDGELTTPLNGRVNGRVNAPQNTPENGMNGRVSSDSSDSQKERAAEVEKAQRVHKGATLKREKEEEARSQSAKSSQNADHLPTPSTALRAGAPATQETPPTLSGVGVETDSLRDGARSLYEEGGFSFSSFEGFAPEPPSRNAITPSGDDKQARSDEIGPSTDRLQADLDYGYRVLVDLHGPRLKKTDSRYVNLKRALLAGHALETIFEEYDRCIARQKQTGGSPGMAMYHAYHALQRQDEPPATAAAAVTTPAARTAPAVPLRIDQTAQLKVAAFEKAVDRYTQKGDPVPAEIVAMLAQARAGLAEMVN